MWIVKGSLLALWLFGLGTITYLYLTVYRHLPPHASVDIRSIDLLTRLNPLWWIAVVVCLVLGFAIAHRWLESKAKLSKVSL
jgi:hypothetical protein